jgi:hypothetical protein
MKIQRSRESVSKRPESNNGLNGLNGFAVP